jgi:hypothetical protein
MDNHLLTPLVLSYFAEKDSATRTELTNAIFQTTSKLNENRVPISLLFRGELGNSRSNNITSENVDNELSYWLSNDFIVKCNKIQDSDDICYEVPEKKKQIFSKYKISNIKYQLESSQLYKDMDINIIIQILKEVYLSAK